MNKNLISLGDLYVSDFVHSPEESSQRQKFPLALRYSTKLNCPVLTHQPPAEMMWGKYWYRSSVNPLMREALKDIVLDVEKNMKLGEGDVWLDIASNDGTLLSFVNQKVTKVGIDPAEGEIHEQCSQNANHVVQDFFSRSAYESMGLGKKAKVVTCIAMFYDLQDPFAFAQEVSQILDDEGLVVVQLSYTPLMLKQLAFDNIVAEHYAYHSLMSVENIWKQAGLKIVDVQINDVNGGSIRLTMRKREANDHLWSTQTHRDICHFRYVAIRHWEIYNYNERNAWSKFCRDLEVLKKSVTDFILSEKEKGKTIWGYGASTKGNTLLQYFGLNSEHLDAIAEKSEWKYGLYTIGTNIPIKSEEEMREAQPDYLLILPWHFVHEFSQRESEYLDKGGKFIIPCPKFVLYSKEGYENHNR